MLIKHFPLPSLSHRMTQIYHQTLQEHKYKTHIKINVPLKDRKSSGMKLDRPWSSDGGSEINSALRILLRKSEEMVEGRPTACSLWGGGFFKTPGRSGRFPPSCPLCGLQSAGGAAHSLFFCRGISLKSPPYRRWVGVKQPPFSPLELVLTAKH